MIRSLQISLWEYLNDRGETTASLSFWGGHWFRSSHEARWACFFDAMGIAWVYEPKAFRLSNGTKYIPDFWLPKFEGGIWAEVKPNCDPFTKAKQFALDSNTPIWLCEGWPRLRSYHLLDCPQGPVLKDGVLVPGDGEIWTRRGIPFVADGEQKPHWETMRLFTHQLSSRRGSCWEHWFLRLMCACDRASDSRFDISSGTERLPRRWPKEEEYELCR